MTPRIASSDEEIARCYPAMSSLRPHITESDFVPLVREMENEGYRLAYIESEDKVVAVAGYRLREQAENAGCDAFHLDSGVQRDRAHRFYFRYGFTISSYHFLLNKDAT